MTPERFPASDLQSKADRIDRTIAAASFPDWVLAEVGGELLEGGSYLLCELAGRHRFQLVLDVFGCRGRQIAFIRPAIQHMPVNTHFIPLPLYRGQKLVERHGVPKGLVDA